MRLLQIIAVFLLVFSFSKAETYFIDSNSGNDNNNGTSVSSPWKTISRVNSFTFSPGDIILFKKGGIWSGTITINQDGTSSQPIIFSSYGIGELPVIDNNLSRSHGILISSRKHIIVENFSIRNTTHGAIRVEKSDSVIVMNNDLFVTGRGGVFIEESENCLVAGNNITTPSDYYNEQTDGIYAQRNSNNTYDGNHIVISNMHIKQHCDAMQFYLESDATIKNNYFEQNNTKTGNAQGIYSSMNSGTFRIFNNVGYGMHTTSGLINFYNYGTKGKVEIIGNTMYGGKGGLIQSDAANIILKNNIIQSTGKNPLIVFEKEIINSSETGYNLYKNSNSGSLIIIQKNKGYTLSDWKLSGYDRNSSETDPMFENISSADFTLEPGSPAINKGVNLEAPYNVDMIGTLRPFDGRSDIGAYEMEFPPRLDITVMSEIVTDKFELDQNYPNPFNPSTVIKFLVPENSSVTLKVYDITGSEVDVLINDFLNAGMHQVEFNAAELASGTYIYVLTAGELVKTKKMILIK
jgi:parallel beta-helix repeat protein